MTVKELVNILSSNNIPLATRIVSDSGWECQSTECDGVYYYDDLYEGCVVLTQSYNKEEEEHYIYSKKERRYIKRICKAIRRKEYG